MRTRIPLLATLTIISTLITIPFAVNTARAIPGLDVLDPGNTWSPYGTFAVSGGANTLRHISLKYYTGDAAEFAAFQAGGSNGLDITDDGTSGNGLPPSQWPNCDTNPDWICTPSQGSANWQGIYFNGASSTWANWGCRWNFYNSLCGQEMRQAFAHLINRPDFAATNDPGNSGQAIWDDVPANKVLSTCFSPTTVPCDGTPPAPGVGCPTLPTSDGKACTFQSPSAGFCYWDTLSNVECTAAKGPYLVGATGSGNGFPTLPSGPIGGGVCGGSTFPYASPITSPGSWSNCNSDFALAAAHLIRANVSTTFANANYQIGGAGLNIGVAAHHLRLYTRSTEPRRTMGIGWSNALKLILGTGGAPNVDAVDIQLGSIIVCGLFRVFSEPPTSPIDDWDAYTYGYSAGGP